MIDVKFWYAGGDEIGEITEPLHDKIAQLVDDCALSAVISVLEEDVDYIFGFECEAEQPDPDARDIPKMFSVWGNQDHVCTWSLPQLLRRSFSDEDYPERLRSRLIEEIEKAYAAVVDSGVAS